MRRLLAILAVLALVVPVSFAFATAKQDGLSEARIMGHIRALSVEIGSRPAGLQNSVRAAEYIAKELSSYGYQVRFQTFSFTESYTRGAVNVVTKNVIGSKPGRDTRNILVIGAHYDSVAEAPGADDNASGVAAMLEVARVVSAANPAITIEFVAFGAEEDGLVGSREYVRQIPKEKTVVGMINLDMIGVGKTFGIYSVSDPNSMVERALSLAKTLGISVMHDLSNLSDHASFDEAGIPAVFFNRPENDDIHTPKDTIEKIVPSYVAEIARLTLALVESFI